MIHEIIPSRSKQGSILAICIASLFILVGAGLFGIELAWSFLAYHRYQQVLEAAALRAAADLSEIVINDPYFGFISLSDRPAIGQATIAADGEPLPVRGINTIIATTRLDYIVASMIQDERLKAFARQDAKYAREAAMRLVKVLERALQGDYEAAKDMDGNTVRPYRDALNVYRKGIEHLSHKKTEEFKLTLGWLKECGTITVTPIPYANSNTGNNPYVTLDGQINGCYKAYIDLPVGDEHFSFAGLGTQTLLANVNQFVGADKEHVSTTVKAQAICELPNIWGTLLPRVTIQACALPYAESIKPEPSVLVLSFPDGFPSSIDKMRDLLFDHDLNKSVMGTFTPIGDDYPTGDRYQLIRQTSPDSAKLDFALCFHDWLRSNYALPKIDSVLAALNQSLSSISRSSCGTLVVAVKADGNVVISRLIHDPFVALATRENQLYSVSSTPIPIHGGFWTVTCRDQVHSLGTISGGKHAGQPLPGDPINWDEIRSYVNESFAQEAATRKLKAMMVAGHARPGGGIALKGAELLREDGKKLNRDIRTSTHSAGLAAEFCLSHPRAALQ